jgi:hypothetical protein
MSSHEKRPFVDTFGFNDRLRSATNLPNDKIGSRHAIDCPRRPPCEFLVDPILESFHSTLTIEASAETTIFRQEYMICSEIAPRESRYFDAQAEGGHPSRECRLPRPFVSQRSESQVDIAVK